MNEKHSNLFLIVAILITIIAMVSVHYFPDKRLSVLPSPKGLYSLYTQPSPAGGMTGNWVDEKNIRWRCVYPENFHDDYFACNFIVKLTADKTRGIDLSKYSEIYLKINYQGSANKIRVGLRNFNPLYSVPDDDNSTKYHALHVHTKELNKGFTMPLANFPVSEWWLEKYNIPLKDSPPDLSNTVEVNIDFYEKLQPGIHEVQVEKIEFVGERINPETWYLGIIIAWMLGFFIYTINRLIKLRQQTIADHDQIEALSNNNEQLKRETDKFRRLSTIDPLTQAYNRFGIDQIVSTLLRCKSDKNTPVNAPDYALVLVDIDHFKRINDRRGHDAGDRVLQGISSIIQKNIREYDFLGRWGGEEFVIILPSTSKAFATDLAETIRLAIHDFPFEPQQPLSVTASFGISDRIDAEDFATTFKRADNALYVAKGQGRNCCVIAEDQLPN